jgi:hypothetical protein
MRNNMIIKTSDPGKIWKEAALAYFKKLSWYSTGRTEENNESSKSGYPHRQILKYRTSSVHRTVTFGF